MTTTYPIGTRVAYRDIANTIDGTIVDIIPGRFTTDYVVLDNNGDRHTTSIRGAGWSVVVDVRPNDLIIGRGDATWRTSMRVVATPDIPTAYSTPDPGTVTAVDAYGHIGPVAITTGQGTIVTIPARRR